MHHNSAGGAARPDRPLDQAIEELGRKWFPPNPDLLVRIRQGFREGAYDLDTSFLISEIKTDFSLFLYSVKELVRILKSNPSYDISRISPIELLERADLTTLRAILDVEPSSISGHSLKDSDKVRADRFKEAMISASTAEVLSIQHNIEPDLGYSTALLRQLGHTLIAWNYPQVYREALDKMRGGAQLDFELARSLGYSPDLLALSFVRNWGLDGNLENALKYNQHIHDANVYESDSVAEKLQKLCEVGEALARANSPETYPSATTDWETARVALETQCGPHALQTIQSKVRDNCHNYLTEFPEFFKDTAKLDPEKRIAHFEECELIQSNLYLRNCPPHIKKRLQQLYDTLQHDSDTKSALNKLVREIIPRCGFTSGLVYTFDPKSKQLVPRLKIATPELRDESPIRYMPGILSTNPVCIAFECTSPIRGDDTIGHKDLSYLVGALGLSTRVGVLYLEFPHVTVDQEHDPMIVFKALRQALNDCLKLS